MTGWEASLARDDANREQEHPGARALYFAAQAAVERMGIPLDTYWEQFGNASVGVEDWTTTVYVRTEDARGYFVYVNLAVAGSGDITEWVCDGTLTGRALAAILGQVLRDPDLEARVELPNLPFPEWTEQLAEDVMTDGETPAWLKTWIVLHLPTDKKTISERGHRGQTVPKSR